uniref:Uncharacterized protein n=1 Tax=Rhizophora mucronata TaxID=61149 RepID=A0A2P2PSJ3_RHIMU
MSAIIGSKFRHLDGAKMDDAGGA